MFINHPHIPPAFCYRCPFGLEYPGCDLHCAHALESEIRRQGEENVAAFIAEPVVGAALGAVPAPDGYFEKIREICDQYHVLFIADEVMTGFGRLGTWFGMETYGVSPDIVACGKGMGAGYVTIGATIAQDQIWQVIEESGAPFMAGHTMNQNPIACSGTLAVIETIEQEGLLARVQEIGRYLEDRLNELRTHPHVGDVRGRGLMYGIEFVQDIDTQQPFDQGFRYSSVFCQEALKRGLVLYPCQGAVDGVAGDMVLIAPPFIISESEIDEMLGVMEQALQAVQPPLE
jgi:adenosylmethionine-8-amino-7-oxononanoate aminotransferase